MGVGAADTCDGEGAPLDSLQNRKVTPGWLRGQSCPGLALSLVLSNSWAVPAPLIPWFSCTQKGRRAFISSRSQRRADIYKKWAIGTPAMTLTCCVALAITILCLFLMGLL